ncbi:MAG TPA: YdeI/OmpD-associated family protein [Acidimicrobiales bacterium]|nr:YdeI/OmpD-associated family protein [Acidimicrobiales bacterium]HVE26297.1 YdeI/OmpD-associated family protein [Sporichthya sp.]
MPAPETFTSILTTDDRGRVVVPVPFDPNRAWGDKPRHHITGTVAGHRVRGPLDAVEDGYRLTLGAAWLRDYPIVVGSEVAVTLAPEGPQRAELPPDVAEALEADPAAAAFFDALATFYRKGYLRWIDGTKRRPDVRAARIAEMIDLLKAGKKERPRG